MGLDIDGPRVDLADVEREMLTVEQRLEGEGSRIVAALIRVRDVHGVSNGPSFVRFARAFIDRHEQLRRIAIFAERSFVVRAIADPIALMSPRVALRLFPAEVAANGWIAEVDATFQPPAPRPP